jgi:error-prone DNA polymerase
MSVVPPYAELHCCSNFSFLRGASHGEELVRRAHALGYFALAITDECSLAGVVRAHVAAKEVGLHLVIGSEFTTAEGQRLVVLATNRKGYGNLAELITLARRRAGKGSYRLLQADLDGATDAPHLAGLPDCLVLYVADPGASLATVLADATWMKRVFGTRAWLAVELLHRLDDDLLLDRLRTASAKSAVPLTAAGDVEMHVRSRKPLQDTLTAIRLGLPLDACGTQLRQNAEQHLRNKLHLARLYDRALLEESVVIARRCSFSLDELRYEYPEEVVPKGETHASYLRRMVNEGLALRYPEGASTAVLSQIEHELALIADLGYESYFLTVFDIVRFARSKEILCQGRGSAANSAVCYCLGITEVDPARGNLLFERFISRERGEPPDIDVDFEHQRREEVIQYIYDRYGRDRAAIAATVISYRPRSAIRDVGSAFGIDLQRLSRLSSSHAWWDGAGVERDRLIEHGFDPESPVIVKLGTMVNTLLRFPRHLSQHVGGFVISRDRLSRMVPIENAAMPDRSVIQWDKDDLEALGLLKVDVLALGMLSAIRRALDLVSTRYGRRFRMQDVPAEDPQTYAMIAQADTVGVFQIESRAQMSMLPRLRPATFYDLVVEVAIVRPGPIQGGMVHPYLRRRQGKEAITYPSPEVRSALERTLGVPIFQEQVMQLAVLAAGFSTGEADQLRRSMSAWKRKGGLGPFHARIIDGMTARGYTREFADQIFRQIEGFGEYGFPESHAASFALLVYVSSWLKCHEPAAFLCAMLNSQPMGFYSPSQLIQDGRRHGIDVRPVDISVSMDECTLEENPGLRNASSAALRIGFNAIKGLTREAIERIVRARRERAFDDCDDLCRRAALSSRDLELLAAADALAAIAGHRRHARWAVAALGRDIGMMREAPVKEPDAVIQRALEGQEIAADYASIGLTLRRHPLALLRPRLARMRLSTAEELRDYPNGRLARTSGIVTVRQRPSTAKGVIFVTLEDETGCTNIIVWNDVSSRQRRELLGSMLLTVYGVWQREGEVRHLVARRLVDHSHLLGQLHVDSRDFH